MPSVCPRCIEELRWPITSKQMPQKTSAAIAIKIGSALAQAKTAAGDKNVRVGGANIARQFLETGMIDEVLIHLVPVLLGEGIRLFEQVRPTRFELERIGVIEAPGVTHLRFRVKK